MEESKVTEVLAEELQDPEKVMILVGFGKKDIDQLLKLIENKKEEEVIKIARNSPPRWRRLAICSDEDVKNMKIFTEFLAKKLSSKIFGL